MQITLENKRTREQLVLSFDEFKAQFKTEFERNRKERFSAGVYAKALERSRLFTEFAMEL